jgi:prepilin-type N-terminal cleavage/methylation domain-containing protein
MKKLTESQAGFTLVELLVSIVVAAVVTASLTQVVTSYVHMSQRGRYLNIANAYVEAKVEAIRNLGYNGLNSGTTDLATDLPTQLPRIRSGSMTVTTPYSGIKKVDISVTYNDQGQNNSYNYTTYVGELGVGQ